MVFWILASLVVYLASVFLPAVLYLPTEGLRNHLGGRDNQPPRPVVAERARKAHENMKENMLIFLPLALLSLIVDGSDMGLAQNGAMLFVLARIAYPIGYMIAIPGPRSLSYFVGQAGCLMIALAII